MISNKIRGVLNTYSRNIHPYKTIQRIYHIFIYKQFFPDVPEFIKLNISACGLFYLTEVIEDYTIITRHVFKFTNIVSSELHHYLIF